MEHLTLAFPDALFQSLTERARSEGIAAEEYRKEIDDVIDLSYHGLGHINRSNIREHYQIESLIIPRLGASPHAYFFVAAECSWEEEHGMEILVKDGTVVSCGMADLLYMNQGWDDYI